MRLTINPAYEEKEALGSLMSHYAALYSISMDLPFIKPTIIRYDFNCPTAMKFFNDFDEKILYHEDVFENFNTEIEIISHSQAQKLEWYNVDMSQLSHRQILQFLNNKNYITKNFICTWFVLHNFFEKHLEDICNYLFAFKPNIILKTKQLLPETNKKIVAVCIRNQYKKFECPHTILDAEYYAAAMSYFGTEYKFLIFSDFLDEAKDLLNTTQFEKFDIEYTQKMSSAIGLCLMSMCDHVITANSSFSYWASLLNKSINKKIVCNHDFIDPVKNKNLAEIINGKWYPKSWITIKNNLILTKS